MKFSFLIVDRIHQLLESRGLRQKDLAFILGKNESEISIWMRGTHNFTIDTISQIEDSLGEPILEVVGHIQEIQDKETNTTSPDSGE